MFKKNYFPFGNYHFETFPLRIVSEGEVIPGPLSMASRTLFCGGGFGMEEQCSPKQHCVPAAEGQVCPSEISTNSSSATKSHHG